MLSASRIISGQGCELRCGSERTLVPIVPGEGTPWLDGSMTARLYACRAPN